jgi:hypothetical protein
MKLIERRQLLRREPLGLRSDESERRLYARNQIGRPIMVAHAIEHISHSASFQDFRDPGIYERFRRATIRDNVDEP